MSAELPEVNTPLLLASTRSSYTKPSNGTTNLSLDALDAMFSDIEDDNDNDNNDSGSKKRIGADSDNETNTNTSTTEWKRRPTQKRQHRRHKLTPLKTSNPSRSTKKTSQSNNKREISTDALNESTLKKTRSITDNSTPKIKTVSENFVRLQLRQRGQKRSSATLRRKGISNSQSASSIANNDIIDAYHTSNTHDYSTVVLSDQIEVTTVKHTIQQKEWLQLCCIDSPLPQDNLFIVEITMEQVVYYIDLDKVAKTLWPHKTICLSPDQIVKIQNVFNGKNTILLDDDDDATIDYQLVYSIYSALPGKSISIVVVPIDNVHCSHLDHLPLGLNGGCLHGFLSMDAYISIINRILKGEINVLYITAEQFTSSSFMNILNDTHMPPIRSICLLEAQSLSPYSDQFRWACVRLEQMLQTIPISSGIMAIVNTVTTDTLNSLYSILGIPTDSTITITASLLRIKRNLQLTASKPINKDDALVKFLQRPDVQYMDGIVVYVLDRNDVERLLFHLRRFSITVGGSYRGMASDELKRVEEQWISGQFRVLVTTFTMQSSIPTTRLRGIFYYHILLVWNSIYTHSVGKDGRPSFIHICLDDDTFQRRKSYAYRDGAEAWSLRHLFSYLFFNNHTDHQIQTCTVNGKQLLLLSWETLETDLNMSRYTLQLILYLLSLHSTRLIHIIAPIFTTGKIYFTRLSASELANKYSVIDALLRCGRQQGKSCRFSIPKAAALLNQSPMALLQELHQLKRQRELRIEFYDESLLVQVDSPLTESRLADESEDEAKDRALSVLQSYLIETLNRIERYRVLKIEQLYQLFNTVIENVTSVKDEKSSSIYVLNQQQHEKICTLMQEAFNKSLENIKLSNDISMEALQEIVGTDINAFIERHPSIVSGRAVAGIFHKLSSPCFPAAQWKRDASWGKYIQYDLSMLAALVTRLMVTRRLGQ
ncbi:hypothetical protein BDF19DRAFT_463290 [Syncephalis fuscata]|nr:hypothetical protein BDF19DRAFT_463290 [Syncephalis fuscata]